MSEPKRRRLEGKNDDHEEVLQLRMEEHNLSTGELHASLIWNDPSDLDLHVVPPSGERIFFGHKESRCGGLLDKDFNAGGETSLTPVENVFFASAPSGKYLVYVHNYGQKVLTASPHFSDPARAVPFRVRLKRGDDVQWFSGAVGPHQKQTCFEFNYTDGSGTLGSFIVLPGRDAKSTFKAHCLHFGVTYNPGQGFYGLRRTEKVSTKKDVLLHDTTTDTFDIGRAAVFAKLGLDPAADHKIKPADVPEHHTLFVQSTSNNRAIPPHTKVLMCVGVREALRFRMPDRYNHLVDAAAPASAAAPAAAPALVPAAAPASAAAPAAAPALVPAPAQFALPNAVLDRAGHVRRNFMQERPIQITDVTWARIRARIIALYKESAPPPPPPPQQAAVEVDAGTSQPAFLCPITMQRMAAPVICPEGYTFDNEAIKAWLRLNECNPLTRTRLTVDMLTPNRALQDAMRDAGA